MKVLTMKTLIKLVSYLVLIFAVVVTSVIGTAYVWTTSELAMPSEKVDVLVPPGAKVIGIARLINQAGVSLNEQAFVWLARISELDKKIKAGGYQLKTGDTPWSVLQRMAQGDVSSRQVALIEGWNFKQIRNALKQHPDLISTLGEAQTSTIGERLGIERAYLEGLFFPDTYNFFVGSSDIEILARAYKTGQQILDKAWQERAPDLPLQNPYEALILASLVEKETGSAQDRARIAGVFVNRLKAGMPLQTDPSVIYGLGDAYDGKIRKKDLQTDTPWNTYTRGGLPPSPIASVGRASLNASLHPEQHNFLYFVAKGDGASVFASTLAEHNKNVATYILNRK
jgi:UPF0755 protein